MSAHPTKVIGHSVIIFRCSLVSGHHFVMVAWSIPGINHCAFSIYPSNPHPYAHPYLNHANQQPNTYPPRTAEMVANNTYYAKEVRAPTKVSVGPDWQSAPTEIRVGPNEPMPPTTLSVPPVREQVQHGGGITIKIDDEDDTDVDDDDMDTDDEDDTDEDDEEEQGPGVFDVLVDIAKTFKYLKDLRKQYRDLLPQLKEMNQGKMGCFLQVYSHVKRGLNKVRFLFFMQQCILARMVG